MKRILLLTLVALSLAAPAAQAGIGPDYVSSDNVELVGRLKMDGTGVGARIIGNTMFVTSTTSLSAYDITDAENPQMLGALTLNVQFENEDVPTNGKVLGISSDTFCVIPDPIGILSSGSAATGGCLSLYDVSDPANIRLIKVVEGAGDHTQACILDCQYMYGSEGTIVDLRDPANAEIVGDWTEKIGENFARGCHDVSEVDNGIIVGSCQPVQFLSVLPEHGGSPLDPVVLATGANEDERFIHSSLWPRLGRDKFLLVGGEDVAQPQCGEDVSAFMTWDATKVINPNGGWNPGSRFTMLDEVRPVNGSYVDGHSPYNALGCSVHWFNEHPTFKDGGLVALAEYENGTRFLQITAEGKIVEQGYFLPLGGSTSAPHWHPNGQVVYNIDYTRGIDVLRYTGETYVPGGPGGGTPGTGGEQPDVPACASAAGFRTTKARRAGRGVRFTVDKRQDLPFTVDVFQNSQGRELVRNRRVALLKNRRGSFRWNGRSSKGRIRNGVYYARLTMKLPDGAKDVRRLTLVRKGGRWKTAPDFYQRTDCGIFRSFKLSSPVFGGTSNGRLGVAIRLAQRATSLKLRAIVGGKVVKRFKAEPVRGRTQRFSLPASAVARGKRVKIRATVVQGTRRQVQTLVSKRL